MKLRISAWGTGEAPTTSGLLVSVVAAPGESSPPQAATPRASTAARGRAMRRMRFLSVLGMREAASETAAEDLQERHERDQADHGGDRDRGLVARVAVADGHVAEASAADGARHGR